MQVRIEGTHGNVDVCRVVDDADLGGEGGGRALARVPLYEAADEVRPIPGAVVEGAIHAICRRGVLGQRRDVGARDDHPDDAGKPDSDHAPSLRP